MRKWQQRWDTADCGEWTRSLIGDIETWMGRKFGGINYFKRDNNKCIYCDEIDSRGMCSRECQRWAEQRRTMEYRKGRSATDAVEKSDKPYEEATKRK
ncbi:hypothetical protein NQ317_017899 [Molorchus minor]|uniref:Uncharacterized protein n=1 Tax=Molorchus minor TaxID=1323400 RepID=A0ABQ9IXX9_9CUCU|nr:hypothetical protein NQ317_017899 [Molorchus minor]